MRSRRLLVPLCCVATALIAIAVVVWCCLTPSQTFLNASAEGDLRWESGWVCASADGAESALAFPAALPHAPGQPAVVHNTLPDTLEPGTWLYLKTNYQPVQALIDGEILPVEGMSGRQRTRAGCELPWVRVAIPEDAAGRTLTLHIGTGGSKRSVELSAVYIGGEMSVQFCLTRSALPSLMLCAMMLMLAVTQFCFAVSEAKRFRKYDLSNVVFLTLFTLLCCVWFVCDSDLQGVSFIGSEPFFLANLFSYMLLPLPFILYIRRSCAYGRRTLGWVCAAISLHAAAECALLLFGGFALSTALTISHALLGAALGCLFYIIFQESRARGRRQVSELLIGLSVLGVTSVMTILRFYLHHDGDNSAYFRYGMFLFDLLLTLNAIRADMDFITKERSYEQLRIREEEYRIAVEQSDKYVLRYDIPTRTLHLQADSSELLQLPETIADVPQSLLCRGVVLPEGEDGVVEFFSAIHSGEPKGSVVIQLHTHGGTPWYRFDFTTIFSETQEPLQCVLSFHDVTDMRQKELAYEKWRQGYQEMPSEKINYYECNLSRDAFNGEEGGMLPRVPAEVERRLDVIVRYLCEHWIYESDREKFLSFLDRERLLASYGHGIRSEKADVRRVDENDRPLWTAVSVQLISDPYSSDVKCFLMLKDEDAEKRAELKQRARSNTDPLTGLLNRTAFVEQVTNLFEESADYQTHALMMLDVDGFKRVNDTFGHQFGDRVLIDIANDLRAMMRADDFIGRLGGDEYVVCLKNVPEASMGFLERRSQFICEAISKQFGSDVAISGSLGIALFHRDGRSFDELYQKADKALYYAKHHGKNRYVFFNDSLMQGDVNAPSSASPVDEPVSENTVAAAQSAMTRTLLIVDDVELNRELLGEIFHEEYHVLMAESGDDALRLLQRSDSPISAVLLDLIMPGGMDGLEVLRQMRGDAYMSAIPVIVTSAADEMEFSLKAIELGAVDFVSKPIDPRLVKLRVRNAIQKRETDDLRAQNRYLLVQKSDESRHQNQLRYLAEHDPLTNICNKAAFYRKTKLMLDKSPDVTFVMVSFDISHFRVINEIFGHEEGDRLLRFIASRMQSLFAGKATYSRIDADNFTLCLPYNPEALRMVSAQANHTLKEYDLPFDILLNFGLYIIEDRSLPVNLMHDRAELAKRTVKGNYLKRAAYYDDALRRELLEEQEIVNDMNIALEEGHFFIVLQPKCSLKDGGVVGAEALVRWNHPSKGLLSPGQFIPIFEKNGFVMKLDAFVWEQACKLLQKWRDAPIHISVNISRVDIYNPNLVKTLTELVRRYDIPPERLELEITETAYADNAKLLLDVIADFKRNGFVVEMDDFGSGYSSLNMLKQIPVDVLKIDMQFLSGTDTDGRGGDILASVVGMAQRLSLPVVAEGVETRRQAEFLASLGCDYAQGYYYYRPMPVEDFARLLPRAEDAKAKGGVPV